MTFKFYKLRKLPIEIRLKFRLKIAYTEKCLTQNKFDDTDESTAIPKILKSNEVGFEMCKF